MDQEKQRRKNKVWGGEGKQEKYLTFSSCPANIYSELSLHSHSEPQLNCGFINKDKKNNNGVYVFSVKE